MFDVYHKHDGPRVVTKTVHEHRAPTDASIKILSEMEEKITARIVDRMVMDDNGFEVAWVVFDDPASDSKYAECKFKLAGHDHRFRIEVGRIMDRSRLMFEVAQKVRQLIAAELTVALFPKLHEHRKLS